MDETDRQDLVDPRSVLGRGSNKMVNKSVPATSAAPQPRLPLVRSRQKALRSLAIVDAAEELIRETRSTSFSMLMLAERAGLSPATPYNIFGSKASILHTLLSRSLDGISMKFDQSSRAQDSFEVVLEAARTGAQFFVADPSYYRPLYQHLIGVSDPVHRPLFMERSFQYWRSALAGVRRDGALASDHAHDLLARSILILFLGALDLWVQADLDDEQFCSYILYGVCSLLCGVAPPSSRPFLERTMTDIASLISRS